jgi:hypothetical protein
MAVASAPTVVSSGSFYAWLGKTAGAVGEPQVRVDRNVIRVGSVVVAPGDNTTVPLGGTFDCWYDKSAHSFLIDIVSGQVGGPV